MIVEDMDWHQNTSCLYPTVPEADRIWYNLILCR